MKRMPSMQNIVQAVANIYSKNQNKGPKNPKTLSEISYLDNMAIVDDMENSLVLYDSVEDEQNINWRTKDRFIIFIVESKKEILEQCRIISIDATFKVRL